MESTADTYEPLRKPLQGEREPLGFRKFPWWVLSLTILVPSKEESAFWAVSCLQRP
ncbi:hypothetical protein SAY86_018607 [Trapa natans]|uniref:Uncharacterized protein n=1 Tax=Trapa natans TaxID=22666 RepID=A0AAN7LGK6_TRANT|nr:hypothetical protein SAY86_018607 [Trapa natans]